jgi:RND family efflux transporter MFP subunit
MKTKLFGFAIIAGAAFLVQSCGGGEATSEEKEEKQLPKVELETITLKPFTHEIRVQGNIETDQDIILNAEMGGVITSINVKEGQKVSKGSVIATVDASILASNMVELETQLDYAKYMLEKQEELNKRGVGSEFDLEAAKNQVKALESKIASLSTQKGKATIKAPFTGVIDQVFAKNGQMAGPQSPIVRLVNNNTIDLIASISEKHFAKVKVGTDMRVSFPNYGDTSILLKIDNVGNYIEPTNRTFRIKSTIKNNDYFLPNMLAEVSITDMKVEDGLVVPSIAVLKDQESNDYVFVIEKSGNDLKVKKVIVKVIERFEGATLIQDGDLDVGQNIVVGGARGITHGDLVRTK